MLDNPFRKPPEGLDPDDEAFLKRFGGLEDDCNTVKPIPKIEEVKPSPADAVSLGITAGQREAFLNELVDIAPGFKVPRKEYEAVVEIFKIINEDVPEGKRILIGNVVGNEGSGKRIRVKENHVICLFLWYTPIQSLNGVKLPEGLQGLNLAGTPIQSLDGIKLPQGLKYLYLSDTPLQSIDGVTLPEGLQTVRLGGTPIYKNPQKMTELKAKYPNIEFQY